MELFRIGTVDFTKRITVPSYKVNRHPQYHEWVNGNGVTRRHVYRQKISGTFTMRFVNPEDYFEFINMVSENTGAGGYTPVSVYVNNINEVVNTNVFINFDPANTLPVMGTRKDSGFQVTIEEC